jgi:biopolymer transport protein ExbD
VVRIDIDPAGQVFCNQTPVDAPRDALLPGLRERLRKAVAEGGQAGPLIVVTPHVRTQHERVMDVLSACAAAQVRRLAFGTPAE